MNRKRPLRERRRGRKTPFPRMKMYTKQSVFPNIIAVGRTADGRNSQVKATPNRSVIWSKHVTAVSGCNRQVPASKHRITLFKSL